MRPPSPLSSLALSLAFLGWAELVAADQAQWGERYTRNMVSAEKNLPETCDPETGKNVKWAVDLGTQTYATPIVASGRVLVGTNNGRPRDPRHKGDRGVLMCFREADGAFLWQLVVPKRSEDPYLDWPRVGIVSSPTVEGNRAYIVTNRDEVVCLDLNGQADGNDGPFRDEGRHAVPADLPALEVGETDADIIWLFDIPAEVGAYPHDAAHSSILIHGPFLYLGTSNGVDSTHKRLPAPEAPSLIVLEKATGRLVAKDNARIGPEIAHSTWSSPSLGEVNGRPLIFFGGANGVCYAFEALRGVPEGPGAALLETVWRFDCDPDGPKGDLPRYQDNRQEGPIIISGMPVFHEGRVYVSAGGDVWHGRREAWLKCIDGTKTGDITESGKVCSFALQRHCMSTPSIHDGLAYITDCGRYVHCIDAKTGRLCWNHRTRGEMWGCTLVADGKVYAGTDRGNLWIFAAGREKKVIDTVDLGHSIVATPVAANGVLYVATMRKLYGLARPPVSAAAPKRDPETPKGF